jgi:predicted HTH domain antitoxin
MKTLVINLPELSEVSEHELKMILAGEYYERGKLSLGHAAQLVGISKKAFIETMGNFGYSVFGQDADEIISDLQNE